MNVDDLLPQMQAEVAALPDAWIPKPQFTFEDTNPIWYRQQLVGCSENPDIFPCEPEQVAHITARPIAAKAPACMEAVRRLPGFTYYATFSRLHPGSVLRRHIDVSKFPERWALYHIPVTNNPGSLIVMWNDKNEPTIHCTRAGEIFILPLNVDHMAVNGGHDYRVHLYVFKNIQKQGDSV